jgi:CheY-like chemotaxis protein
MDKPAFVYVEDDATSREVMEILFVHSLRCSQYWIFEDSANFIPKLEAIAHKPDIIFLDIHMKPYSGFELLDMIRKHPNYGDSKVIALTASVMNEEVQSLENAGFDGAIAKPIKAHEFPRFVHQILQGEQVWHVT